MNYLKEKINYDEIIKNLFPYLTFEDEGASKEIFKEYLLTKGVYLHKHVYDAILSYFDKNKVIYDEIANFIRYDKSIRDKLYIYLSAAEEFLRSELFNTYEFEITSKQLNAESLIEKKDLADSNLYWFSFSKELTFRKLVDVLKVKNITQNIEEMNAIVDLRNKVMHHSLLFISKDINKQSIDDEIEMVANKIVALYNILPTDGLKKGLIIAINKSNYEDGDITKEPIAREMRLRRFKNGVFI